MKYDFTPADYEITTKKMTSREPDLPDGLMELLVETEDFIKNRTGSVVAETVATILYMIICTIYTINDDTMPEYTKQEVLGVAAGIKGSIKTLDPKDLPESWVSFSAYNIQKMNLPIDEISSPLFGALFVLNTLFKKESNPNPRLGGK